MHALRSLRLVDLAVAGISSTFALTFLTLAFRAAA